MSEIHLPAAMHAASPAEGGSEPGLPVGANGETTFLILDTRGNIRYCSRPELFGSSNEELRDQPIRSLVPSLALRDRTPGYNVAYARFWSNHDMWQRHPVTPRSGAPGTVEIRLQAMLLDRRYCLLAELRLPQRAILPRNLERLMQAAEASSEAIVVTDTRGTIEYANAAFEGITGYRRDEAVGENPRILASGVHGPEFFREMWSSLSAGREFRGVFVNRRRSGSLYHEEKVIRPFVDAAGRVTHFVSIGRDVTARFEAPANAARPAGRDELTNLPDRRLFGDRLHQAIARSGRRSGAFCLLRVGIDGLPQQRAAAEHLLRMAAAGLCRIVRDEDTVARMDDHSFALILEEAGSFAAAERLAERIVTTLNRELPADVDGFNVSASVGACFCPQDGDDAATLMRRAELALGQARAAGGDGLAFFRDDASATPRRLGELPAPVRADASRVLF